jgi:hypothetical protein
MIVEAGEKFYRRLLTLHLGVDLKLLQDSSNWNQSGSPSGCEAENREELGTHMSLFTLTLVIRQL